MKHFKEIYNRYKEYTPIFNKAKSLIQKYGKVDNIPWGEIKTENSGFEESDLLVCCKVIEEKMKEEITIQ
ncbi:hypothetical protein KAI92_05085 [Candidatus Parcubacteria bacterium]|nr:hypothetical protein [Candidatus Parcubacteria bacterium]